MYKLKILLLLLTLPFANCVYGELRPYNLRSAANTDSITVVVNRTNPRIKTFRYIDYWGEPRVGSFPETDTLRIINRKGIAAYTGFGSAENFSYCMLYPGDTISLNIADGKEHISSGNKALQVKIELMKKLLQHIQVGNSSVGNDLNKDLKLINDRYADRQQLIQSYSDKINAKDLEEVNEISDFNRMDSTISLYSRYHIKNDSLFSLKTAGAAAWNYMAFGHLSYQYLTYIRKVYHVHSSIALMQFVHINLQATIRENMIFNFLTTYEHNDKYKLDTLNRLTLNFIKQATNKSWSDYLSANLAHYKSTSIAKAATGIMLTGANDGRSISFDQLINQYKNKVIYLDFWASWCAPCLAEMPSSKLISKKLSGQKKPVVFLYLSEDKNISEWRNKSNDLELPPDRSYILLENSALKDFIKKHHLLYIPRYMIINKQGQLINADALHPADPGLERSLAKFFE